MQIVAQMNTASSPAVIISLQLTAWSAQVTSGMGAGTVERGGERWQKYENNLIPPLISPHIHFFETSKPAGQAGVSQTTWVPFRESILRTLPSVLWNLPASLSWMQLDRSWSCYLEDILSCNIGGLSLSGMCLWTSDSTTRTRSRCMLQRTQCRCVPENPAGRKESGCVSPWKRHLDRKQCL